MCFVCWLFLACVYFCLVLGVGVWEPCRNPVTSAGSSQEYNTKHTCKCVGDELYPKPLERRRNLFKAANFSFGALSFQGLFHLHGKSGRNAEDTGQGQWEKCEICPGA